MKITDKIDLSMWKGWKMEKCSNKLFGIGPKEEIQVEHAEAEI
jgi:hypothetical protein